MSIKERLSKNIDEVEKRIDELILKLQVQGFYKERFAEIKEKYETLQSTYYGKKLKVASNNQDKQDAQSDKQDEQSDKPEKKEDLVLSVTPRYIVDIENDVLYPLEELLIVSNCKYYVKALREGEQISINDVVSLLEQYTKIPNKYKDDANELFNEICDLLYSLIKKDAELNNRFEIIDILYEYKDKDYDYVTPINILFLKEVNELFEKKKGKNVIDLVKHATDSEFDKEDIINLLVATGKKIKESTKESAVNTKSFNESTSYSASRIYHTTRKVITDRIIAYNEFQSRTGVNPLPKTKEENLKLREYDLSQVNYELKRKITGSTTLVNPKLIGVDLSYTNAVIIPRRMGKSIRDMNLEGVDMRGVSLVGVDITGANLLKTGADLTGSIGECLGVSPYEDNRIVVSRKIINPEQFKELTKVYPFAPLFSNYDDEFAAINWYPYHNRILRQYDLSCVDTSFEYIKRASKICHGSYFQPADGYGGNDSRGIDLSYTNININPQEFTEYMKINFEGVDLRDKDFTGVEDNFAGCNLKGTGANLSPKINPTVSEYVVNNGRKR